MLLQHLHTKINKLIQEFYFNVGEFFCNHNCAAASIYVHCYKLVQLYTPQYPNIQTLKRLGCFLTLKSLNNCNLSAVVR